MQPPGAIDAAPAAEYSGQSIAGITIIRTAGVTLLAVKDAAHPPRPSRTAGAVAARVLLRKEYRIRGAILEGGGNNGVEAQADWHSAGRDAGKAQGTLSSLGRQSILLAHI